MKDYQYSDSVRSSPQPDIYYRQMYKRESRLREKQTLQNDMTEEMHRLSKIHPNGRRYSRRMISMLLRVFFVSTAAYAIFALYLPIPSPRTMFKYQKRLLNQIHSSLTNISECEQIIQENTEKWPKNESIILAVDAASVNPAVTLLKNYTIKGLIETNENDELFLTPGGITIQLFENWLKNHSKLIVDSMFLFNVQPLNPDLNSFIIHIYPTNGGKGKKVIIDILKNLTIALKKFNINTISYAADGDSIFSQLHLKNIKNHIINNIFYTSITSSSPLIISDPLHLLKRARYHLIPQIYNKSQILSLLDLPSMVVRSDRASKMHDKLPLLFFQLKNFEILSQNSLYNYSFYILPFSLFLSGLSYDLNFNDRVLLFHISRRIFHYIYKSNKNSLFKGQIKYKIQLINDTFSTLISICDIFNKISNGQIHLNRFGTNPIEHDFTNTFFVNF